MSILSLIFALGTMQPKFATAAPHFPPEVSSKCPELKKSVRAIEAGYRKCVASDEHACKEEEFHRVVARAIEVYEQKSGVACVRQLEDRLPAGAPADK
ncbi:MAG: hypothetical protein ACXVCH_02890 [Bdellovibrionota bacterium]